MRCPKCGREVLVVDGGPGQGNTCDVPPLLDRYLALWWKLTHGGRKTMERQIIAAQDECDIAANARFASN